MSAVRPFTLALLLLCVVVALGSGVASAQTGCDNPSGGSSMRHAGDEGRTVIGAGGLSIDQLLRSWLTTSVARIATAPPRPGVNRTAKGTLPRWMSNR